MFKMAAKKTVSGFFVSILMLLFALPSFSATIPDNIQKFISKDFPNTTFRFDGVIILPDNTIYLPVFPAKILNPETIAIKQTYPSGKTLVSKPDVIILNNDFVLLKVITDSNGNKTILKW